MVFRGFKWTFRGSKKLLREFQMGLSVVSGGLLGVTREFTGEVSGGFNEFQVTSRGGASGFYGGFIASPLPKPL